jgi:hypothetical protein
MPFYFKVVYRWAVKFLQVSVPLKLRNTWYLHPRKAKEDEQDEDTISVPIKAILNYNIDRSV